MAAFDRTPLDEQLRRECSAERLVRGMERDVGDWVSAPEAEAQDAAQRVEPEIARLFERAKAIGRRRGMAVLRFSVPAMLALMALGVVVATLVLR